MKKDTPIFELSDCFTEEFILGQIAVAEVKLRLQTQTKKFNSSDFKWNFDILEF